MKNGIFKESQKKLLFLAAIIVIQLVMIIFCFWNRKQSIHSDEIWSYGFANSYSYKDLFCDETGRITGLNQWTSSDFLWDYLVVNDGERFAYGSVLRNHKYDLSPPLFSLLLHTISSFFPNVYSWWFAFSINLVAFVFTQIFLFLVVEKLADDKAGFLICLAYGFSRGAIDNFIFMRMYAMCTAFTMALLYYMVTDIKDESGKISLKRLIGLYIIAVLSFFSHLYVIPFAGLMTALFCAILLWKKQWKKMFLLGGTMLAALGTFLLLWSNVLFVANHQITSATLGGQETSSVKKAAQVGFGLRYRTLLSFLTEKIFGFETDLYFFNDVKNFFLLILLLGLCASPVWILLIRKHWEGIKKSGLDPIKKSIKAFAMGTEWILPLLLFVSLLQVAVCCIGSNILEMGNYADRYLFNFAPVFVLSILGSLYRLLKRMPGKKWITYGIYGVLILVLLAYNIPKQLKDSYYYFDARLTGPSIRELVKDKKVVYVEDVPWIMTPLADKLYECDEFFRTDFKTYSSQGDAIRNEVGQEEWYLLVSHSIFEEDAMAAGYTIVKEPGEDLKEKLFSEVYDYFQNLIADSDFEQVSSELVFSRKMEVYRISPK